MRMGLQFIEERKMQKKSLVDAGYVSRPATETTEVGEIFTLPTSKHKSGKYEVRIMDGKADGSKGPRAVTTRDANTSEYVKPDGSDFKGASKSERREKSHIKLE